MIWSPRAQSNLTECLLHAPSTDCSSATTTPTLDSPRLATTWGCCPSETTPGSRPSRKPSPPRSLDSNRLESDQIRSLRASVGRKSNIETYQILTITCQMKLEAKWRLLSNTKATSRGRNKKLSNSKNLRINLSLPALITQPCQASETKPAKNSPKCDPPPSVRPLASPACHRPTSAFSWSGSNGAKPP